MKYFHPRVIRLNGSPDRIFPRQTALVAKSNWRTINTIASTWLRKYAPIFVLGHSKLTGFLELLSENSSLLGTDNVREQISEHIFAPKWRLLCRLSRQAVNMTFLSLVSEVATFAISASKHCGQFLNEFFICSHDITPSKYRIDIWKSRELFKWLLLPLDQKSFEELVLKAIKNRKRSGYVDRQTVDWSKLISFKLKLLILRGWWQL